MELKEEQSAAAAGPDHTVFVTPESYAAALADLEYRRRVIDLATSVRDNHFKIAQRLDLHKLFGYATFTDYFDAVIDSAMDRAATVFKIGPFSERVTEAVEAGRLGTLTIPDDLESVLEAHQRDLGTLIYMLDYPPAVDFPPSDTGYSGADGIENAVPNMHFFFLGYET